MTNRRMYLLELLVAIVVTVPLAFALRPAVQSSPWPGPVMGTVVFMAALSLALLIDFTASLLRRGGRRVVRHG